MAEYIGMSFALSAILSVPNSCMPGETLIRQTTSEPGYQLLVMEKDVPNLIRHLSICHRDEVYKITVLEDYLYQLINKELGESTAYKVEADMSAEKVSVTLVGDKETIMRKMDRFEGASIVNIGFSDKIAKIQQSVIYIKSGYDIDNSGFMTEVEKTKHKIKVVK